MKKLSVRRLQQHKLDRNQKAGGGQTLLLTPHPLRYLLSPPLPLLPPHPLLIKDYYLLLNMLGRKGKNTHARIHSTFNLLPHQQTMKRVNCSWIWTLIWME